MTNIRVSEHLLEEVQIGLDYLGATVPGDTDSLLRHLETRLGGTRRQVPNPRGYGYSAAFALVTGDETLATVLHHHDRSPYVIAQGYRAPAVLDLLQAEYPTGCTASRKDAALDLNDPDWWDVVVHLGVEIANRRSLTIDMRGDWLVPGSPKGRTLYVGSRTSVCFVRIYEFRKAHGFGPAVRIELEYKPKHADTKEWLIEATPAEIFGLSPLCIELFQRIGVDLSRTKPRLYRKPVSDLDRAVWALLMQYGKLIEEQIVPHLDGDLTEVGPYLVRELSAIKLRRAQLTHAAAGDSRSTAELVAGVTAGE